MEGTGPVHIVAQHLRELPAEPEVDYDDINQTMMTTDDEAEEVEEEDDEYLQVDMNVNGSDPKMGTRVVRTASQVGVGGVKRKANGLATKKTKVLAH